MPRLADSAGTKSPYYETVACRQCGTPINRRPGVTNPLCFACKEEIDRERKKQKRKVLHISKRA